MKGISFNRQTVAEAGVVVDGRRVTPLAQLTAIRFPVGGIVWSRPVAVEIEEHGRVERVAVLDTTRRVQLLLWSTAAAAGLASQLITIARKEMVS